MPRVAIAAFGILFGVAPIAVREFDQAREQSKRGDSFDSLSR